jgi:hypothetical protein
MGVSAVDDKMLRGCVYGLLGGGSTLSRERDLRADVDDGSARFFQHGQRVMRHRIIMDEVLTQALEETFGVAIRKPDSVVGACVVY